MYLIFFNKKKIKVGITGLGFGYNIGGNLVKYAIFIKLSQLGFSPYIIGTWRNRNITFLKKYTKYRVIKNNYIEIKENEFDILMVNSDQTWRKIDRHFYDIGFLKFAKNWSIPKFVYGTSLGYSDWRLTKKDEKIAKDLLKDFTGISVREKGSIHLIKQHLGIKPILVLDPTLLIEKNNYLKLIKNYKPEETIKEKYIFTYIFKNEKNTKKFVNYASQFLGFKIYDVHMKDKNAVQKFIYGIYHSQAVITNSFHGTIFSIIFNKPFVSFIFKNSPKERFVSLKELLNINNRIFEYDQVPKVDLLKTPLNINLTLLDSLKRQSLNYLKKNLKIKYY